MVKLITGKLKPMVKKAKKKKLNENKLSKLTLVMLKKDKDTKPTETSQCCERGVVIPSPWVSFFTKKCCTL